MMPVVPTTRKPTNFSIESLVGRSNPSPPPPAATQPPPQPPQPPASSRRSPSPNSRSPSSSPVESAAPTRLLPASPRERRTVASSGFQPVLPGASPAALLNELRLKGLQAQAPYLADGNHALDGLHHLHPHLPPLGLHPHGHLPNGLGSLGPIPPGVHPAALGPLMLGPHRDVLPFYPWLMSRHGAYLHRFAGEFVCILS